MNQSRLPIVFLISCLVSVAGNDSRAADQRPETSPDVLPIGAAKVDITPDHAVRLTGYGGRRTESDGVAQRIWAKALALGGDEGDGPAILVTVENCGMTPDIATKVAQRLKEHAGVQRSRLVISVSHTHTGPTLKNWAPFLFGTDLPGAHRQHIDQYTRKLIDKLADVALAALANRREGRLYWTQGDVGFAANRRVLKAGLWTGFGVQPDGPVDHRLPLLVAKDTAGQLVAVVANYACHCTTLGGDFNQIAGDWVGYAQEYIEKEHDGAVALITIGCGADANPEPRGSLALCRQHGRDLADEVSRLLAGKLKPLNAQIDCRLVHVDLPFATLLTQQQWQEQSQLGGAAAYRARQYLERLDRGEPIPAQLSYPVACWSFADDLAMVFLAGEVVVDYAIRLSREFDHQRLWITAYANDVPCYIPSRRILREGGYEADHSMIFYARPTRFSEQVEDILIEAVGNVVPATFHSTATDVGN